MSELVAPQNVQNPSADPRFFGALPPYAMMSPNNFWGSRPYLTSSDILVHRTKDGFSADARDASRSNPYGRSALRSTLDAVIGMDFKLQLEPIASVLGVTEEAAAEWAEMVETAWELDANSTFCTLDAQRKQTFVGLMRTAYACFYVSGEALASVEWKKSFSGTRTCLHLIASERLSDPRGMMGFNTGRRMGVERDAHGAPVAYHIREQHQSDAFWGIDHYSWRRIPRYSPWGRQKILHFFEHDQPDMTRGISAFTTALLPMRLLQDYMVTELESAAIRATYAAVIESELNYEDAMRVIGDEYAGTINKNPVLDFTLRMMADRATYYRGQDFRFGKSKVAHLLPNEELKMVQGNQHTTAIADFSKVNLYMLASALGVDYATLTKNYSDTNYSGARAALFDVWRSYEVRRSTFIAGFAMPFVMAWMEEQVALRKTIPMLGSKSFYDVRDALCNGTFETWSKPRLDPLKENQADKVLYDMGALSLKEMCAADGRDWRRTLMQRAREKKFMADEGLKPEDIDWELIMNKGKDKNAEGEGTGSEGGASTGASANN